MANGVFGFNDLPVECIANVISLTSPKDACRLSLVATRLRSAADSDQVWEKFLPANYREILGRSTNGVELMLLTTSMSKKQVFRHLCGNPLLIDGETKSFWVDKSTGKKCFLLGVRSWIENPYARRFITLRESRFGSALELFWRCIEFSGAINPRMLSPDTRYGVYLVLDTVAGWELLDKILKASVGKKGEEPAWSSLTARKCQRRDDKWLEVELGEVLITGEEDADLMIRVEEKNYSGYWHRGLIVEGIEVRVKH